MTRDQLFLVAGIGLFAATSAALVAIGRVPADWSGVGIVLGAGLTLAIYSFLYRDNPLFKLAEHVYVGIAAAYVFGQVWFQSLYGDLLEPVLSGRATLLLLVPTILGLLMLTRFSSRLGWLSRISFAFFIGLGAGFAIPRYISSFILEQVAPTIAGLSLTAEGLDLLIILVGVISVLVYFFFSVEHTGAVGAVSRVGVWFLMVAFGASFGYTIMARLSLLIGRVTFLLRDWLHVME